MNVRLQGGPFDGKQLSVPEKTAHLRLPISRQLHWWENDAAISKMQLTIAVYDRVDGEFVFIGTESIS